MLPLVKTESPQNSPEEHLKTEKIGDEKAVDRLDNVGTAASFICAVHCALLPLVGTLLPLVGLSFLASEPVEWLLLLSAGFGTASLCLGFKEHRNRRVFAVLAIGIAFLLAGRVFHNLPMLAGEHAHHGHDHAHTHEGFDLSIALMILGGMTMIAAHLFNQNLCKACRKCSDTHCHT